MGSLVRTTFLPLIVIFISILSPSFCMQNVEDNLRSCLINHNVTNFTVYSKCRNNPTYFALLNFSIQNLRPSSPSTPKPTVIVVPGSKQNLVDIILCCKRSSYEIRVRCGGHSYEGESYIADNPSSPFVLIDMMGLDRVSVDLESETAWVGGGATIGQIYFAISESSRVHGFPAGSCPTIGAGGHISGGGFGLLSRKYGLAADNVVDAILIDANGTSLNRTSMGEDVFWGLLGGGGGHFGVIYAWKIKILKVPKIVTGFVVSRVGSRGRVLELVDKWQRVAPSLDDGFYLSAVVASGSATFNGFYLGDKNEAVSILSGIFPKLNVSESDCDEMSWIESVVYFSGLGKGSRVSRLADRFMENKSYFKAKSDYVRHLIPKNGIESAIKMLEQEPKGYVILDPYGGAMDNISNESIAFPHREGNIFSIQYIVDWGEEDNNKSKDYMAWIRRFYDVMTPHVSSGPRAAYVNYLDYDLGVMNYTSVENSGGHDDVVEMARVWGEKYFLKNYDRLVRVKAMIDPLNVFKNKQGIPPSHSGA